VIFKLAKLNLPFGGDIASIFKVEQQARQITRQSALLHKAGNEGDFLDSSYLAEGKLMSSYEYCKEISSTIKGATFVRAEYSYPKGSPDTNSLRRNPPL
jgi:hypothetical protein